MLVFVVFIFNMLVFIVVFLEILSILERVELNWGVCLLEVIEVVKIGLEVGLLLLLWLDICNIFSSFFWVFVVLYWILVFLFDNCIFFLLFINVRLIKIGLELNFLLLMIMVIWCSFRVWVFKL